MVVSSSLGTGVFGVSHLYAYCISDQPPQETGNHAGERDYRHDHTSADIPLWWHNYYRSSNVVCCFLVVSLNNYLWHVPTIMCIREYNFHLGVRINGKQSYRQ